MRDGKRCTRSGSRVDSQGLRGNGKRGSKEKEKRRGCEACGNASERTRKLPRYTDFHGLRLRDTPGTNSVAKYGREDLLLK